MKKSAIISSVLYFVGLIALLFYISIELQPDLFISPMERILILSVFCLFTFLGSRLLHKAYSDSKLKIMKITFAVYFIFYLGLLINFTLFDAMFSRIGVLGTVFSDSVTLKIYIENSLNLIPFATIFSYITAFINHTHSLTGVIINLIGNLIALMPMALFLPIFFKGLRKVLPFVISVAGVVLIIEILQLVFAVGACDIDDLILNVSGALMAFGILHIKPIKAFVEKIIMIEI